MNGKRNIVSLNQHHDQIERWSNVDNMFISQWFEMNERNWSSTRWYTQNSYNKRERHQYINVLNNHILVSSKYDVCLEIGFYVWWGLYDINTDK